MSKIKFLVTQEALERKLTVRELMGMQEGNIRTIATTLSRFVAGPNGLLMDQAKAFEVVCDLTDDEMQQAIADFKAAKESAVVSPTNAAS
jgi:hypothetical protein